MAVDENQPVYRGEQTADASFYGGGGGFSGTRTFYASSTSGGATDRLQTVVILDGLIQSWTQGSGGGGITAGEAIGLLLALTKAA